MLDFRGMIKRKNLFKGRGTDQDVVVSSRVRLARNLTAHPFPGFLNSEEEAKVHSKILAAFQKLPLRENFTILYLKDLSPLERRILLERNIITQDFSLEKEKSVLLSNDESLSVMVNETDHIRIACIRDGLALKSAYEEVDKLDTTLEDDLHYAISLEWGYLNSSLTDIGTGIRASLMVHLPALVMAKLIEKALKAITQVGLAVKGFFGDGVSSLGDMYQISNQISLGLSEVEIMDNLCDIVRPLISYERKARNELSEKKKTELEDKVFRALGILTHCRTISSPEAIALLSDLRLGIALDYIKNISLGRVNALFFLSQKSHIQKIALESDEMEDEKEIDYFRAKVIRDSIKNEAEAGG